MDTETIEKRFESKVDRNGWCHEWTACKNHDGYGIVNVNGRTLRAHRVAWEFAHGAISDGLLVLHHCDNSGCVRLEHLFLGTQADNIRDAVRKGRVLKGEAIGNSKLTVEDILEIKQLHDFGLINQRKLSRMFGVSNQHISLIVNGKRWTHI